MSAAEKHALQGKPTTDDTNARLCFSLSRLGLEEIKLRAGSCQESLSSGSVVRSGCGASSVFVVIIYPQLVVSVTRLEHLRGERFERERGKGSRFPSCFDSSLCLQFGASISEQWKRLWSHRSLIPCCTQTDHRICSLILTHSFFFSAFFSSPGVATDAGRFSPNGFWEPDLHWPAFQ